MALDHDKISQVREISDRADNPATEYVNSSWHSRSHALSLGAIVMAAVEPQQSTKLYGEHAHSKKGARTAFQLHFEYI